jgi:hypothetical protein
MTMLNRKHFKPVILNWFDNYDLLKIAENKRVNSILNKINNHTAKLTSKTNADFYYIIHKCTKSGLTDQIQATFFKKDLPISDRVRNTYKQLIQELCYDNYIVAEVM